MEEIVVRRRRTLFAVVAGLVLAGSPESRAEPAPESLVPAIGDVAQALAEAMASRWEGPRVPWPEPTERPTGPLPALSSRHRPLVVHAVGDGAEPRLAAALDALEIAYDALRAVGLEPPYPDGGRGGSPGFDVYLVDGLEGAPTRAFADAAVAYGALDGVTSFAAVDLADSAPFLQSCVTLAYADALLLALDPAETPDARRAMAAFLTHQITGRYGCGDGVVDAQAAPFRRPLVGAPGDGEGGALFLSRLSRMHDGGTGRFVRALFELSRQRTGDGGELRALPDVPFVLERTLERAGLDVRSTMVGFAIDRYLLLADEWSVPRIEPEWKIAVASLPAHTGPSAEPIDLYGSGYAEVDVRGAPPGSRLRVWLRGEFGVDWSLVAAVLDATGAERTRVTAPPGTNARRSYLAVELEPEAARVLVVTTNLGPPGRNGSGGGGDVDRRYELILDWERDRAPSPR
jgi:hypothetical protein